ncbi:YbaN family protein [Pseudaeromonas sharmana]|uniref:Inner membrane protein n=1 Tax=Pseudaeromonas sharmana TaxID=328412 RepID=A0ABV8CRI0_9GAMM
MLLLQLLGFVFVALAVAGILLPLVPTTPFLLLAAWCFARSSPRFHHWLLHHRWFAPYLRHYQDGGGMARRHKIIMLGLMWAGIGYSIWLLQHNGVRGGLLLIALLVSLHLLRMPTRPSLTDRD